MEAIASEAFSADSASIRQFLPEKSSAKAELEN
jgi:hypothetical protein